MVRLLKSLQDLPSAGGSYVLEVHLGEGWSIEVGRLGQGYFPSGLYWYLGSAYGPGGLRARLGHHLRGAPEHAPRWHVDYLRRLAVPRAIAIVALPRAETLPLECVWSQALAAQEGVSLPLKGFGASDCRAACSAHLYWMGALSADDVTLLNEGRWRAFLAQAAALSAEAVQVWRLP